jgi:hypothetical protein
MAVSRLAYSAAFALVMLGTSVQASPLVPFYGTWSGSTVSAVPVDENTILVVSAGSGQAGQLGQFSMQSPHLFYLDTLVVEGTQQFIGADGDTLNATISGQFVPKPDGSLVATLSCVITGGTGRFSSATGVYTFQITAVPAAFGFDSTASISGLISTPESE